MAARVSFLEDNVSPQLWSDLELKRYANEAEVEACRRSELLFDSTTPDVCQIAVVADVATYPLHSKIRRIGILSKKQGNFYFTFKRHGFLLSQE